PHARGRARDRGAGDRGLPPGVRSREVREHDAVGRGVHDGRRGGRADRANDDAAPASLRRDGGAGMNDRRALRGALVGFAAIGALIAGLAYPFIARGDAWRSATWLAPWWLLAIIAVPWVVWRMTLGAD